MHRRPQEKKLAHRKLLATEYRDSAAATSKLALEQAQHSEF
jgi:hypothetical protein